MKKIMMIMAVILVAAGSQAAAIKWGLAPGSVKNPITLGNMAGAAVYFLYGSQTGVEASILDGTFTTTYGGATFLESKLTAAAGNIATVVYENASLGNGIYNFFVVTFDANTFATANNYQISSVIASATYATTGDPLPPATSVGWNNGSLDDGNAAGSTSGWEAIPEPTSLALLAIGVAAIGLRRRFRA